MIDIFSIEPNKIPRDLSNYTSLIYGKPKTGKGQRPTDVVLTPEGFVQIKDLVVGQQIMGEDGRAYTLEGIFPRGKRDFYKITFTDGAEVYCSDDHLWTVQIGQNTGGFNQTVEMSELLNIPIKNEKGYNIHIPLTKPQFLEGYEQDLDFHLRGIHHGNSQQELEDFENYLVLGVENRIELLRGLLDADHWITGEELEFETANKELANQVRVLVQSLGGLAQVKQTGSGVFEDYIVKIRISKELNPLTSKEQLKFYHPVIERSIKSIDHVGLEECVCIKTSNPTELYITNDFVVTHNTTVASKFDRNLLLAFEIGYKAISGVKAQPIKTWSDVRVILKQLRTPKAREHYEVVTFDTFGLAYELAVTYICQKEGVSKLSDIPYGAGHGMVFKEVLSVLREIQVLGFGVILIAHSAEKTELDPNGQEYTRLMPELPKKAAYLANSFVDNIIFCASTGDGFVDNKVIAHFRATNRYQAGSRFKFITDKIELNYENLVNALNEAIEKEESFNSGSTVEGDFFEKIREDVAPESEIDFGTLMNKTKEVINKLMEKDKEIGIFIQSIIEETLGTGKKLSECNSTQKPFVYEIYTRLNNMLIKEGV